LAVEFGKCLGQVIGVSRLLLGEELQVEVDKVIKEGWKLSEAAGKQLSEEQVEEFRGKCDALMEKVKGRAIGEKASSSS
jgi:hypothetical protein